MLGMVNTSMSILESGDSDAEYSSTDKKDSDQAGSYQEDGSADEKEPNPDGSDEKYRNADEEDSDELALDKIET